MGIILLIIAVVAFFVIKSKIKTKSSQVNSELQEIHRHIDAANNGNVDSMHWLGTYYMSERLKMKDLSSKKAEDFKNRSIQWFTKAIDCGDTRSMMTLARQYCNVLNTNQSGFDIISDNSGFGYDPKKEETLTRMAAEAGDAYAQYRLASDIGDIRTKIFWLEKSANQGYYKAYQALGDVYFNKHGNPLSTEYLDLGKAEHFYYLAMNSNDDDICPYVAHDLGMLFGRSYVYNSKNKKHENPERAIYWFYQSVLWENDYAQKNIDDIINNSGITIKDEKYRQWRYDFQNNNYLNTEQLIPYGTKETVL